MPMRRAICAILVTAIIVTAVRFDSAAKPNGKTWTAEIAAGAALLYYLAKLGIDNNKADKTGVAADGVVDWKPLSRDLVNAPPLPTPTPTPPPPGAPTPAPAQQPCPPLSPMPSPPDSMRAARARLVNDIGNLNNRPTCGGKIFAAARTRYEKLRTCWNAFIFAAPTQAPASNPKAQTPTTGQGATNGSANVRVPGATTIVRFAAFAYQPLPPGPFPGPSATPVPSGTAGPSTSTTPVSPNQANPATGQQGQQNSQDPTKKDPCTTDFATVDQAYALAPGSKSDTGASVPARDERIDLTDLADAMNAPPLSQQILDLRVGSHVDDDALRAHLLYVLARALDDSIIGRPPPFPIPGTITGATGAGSIDLTTLSKSCVLNLDAQGCIAALGAAEATAAADRRRDVSCDVSRRSWLPPYTAIVRRRKELAAKPLQDFDVDKNPWFGAVAGC